jgi:acyl-CoA carboxylase subunit beta
VSDRLTAHELIDRVLDAGSFSTWDSPVDLSGYEEGYAEQLARAQQKSGTDEAVVTGTGTLRGHQVAVIVGEFRFL